MKHILFILLLSVATVASAQTSFDETGKKFKAAVAKGDMNALADMMQFPFSSFDWGSYVTQGSAEIQTREDFLKVSKKIFFKKVMQIIAKSEFKKIEDEDEGTFYYTLVFYRSDQSAAWIIFNLADGKWKAVGTDNVSM
jgi:uncharacterized FlgJ-related protein